MTSSFYKHLQDEIENLKNNGLFKVERTIVSPQEAVISLDSGKKVLNFCANNYLGLADHPEVLKAASDSLKEWGFGLASVRFICGTQAIHKKLEDKLSDFLGTEDTILYSSCFDANGGLFEPFFTEEDAIISDSLNHASIIDGIRLCKAKRFRYNNNDMADLEEKLKEALPSRFKIIATDGVFSMDGIVANLKGVCDLAEKYGALVMVDDCHAVGFMGKNGKGTHEYRDVMGRVDFITGTLGKALGGASGGYVSGKKEAIEWLRQKSRPYLFSNTLCPSIAAASIKAIEIVENDPLMRKRVHDNSKLFREEMTSLGFNLVPGDHPIIAVMLGDAKLAQAFAKRMLEEGIYVVGFFYPVVPMHKARIRTQMSAAHTTEHILTAVKAFEKVGKELNVIS
jgi:glycine C-acetyltransferase